MNSAITRTACALAAAGMLLGMLSACVPEPAPTPTETALFASDEEAFAAAEETYRAYTKALNAVDLTDPASFEGLFSYSTGDFQTADRRTFSQLHADRLTMVGSVDVSKFYGIETRSSFVEVIAGVCVDVSNSDVIDADGVSRVSPDRPEVNPLRVTFTPSEDRLLIARADRDEDVQCASE